MNLSRMLDRGTRLCREGRLEASMRICRRCLDYDPDNPDALHLLGLAHAAAGQVAESVSLLERAVENRAGSAVFRCDLGAAYQAAGRLADARASFERVLAIQPGFPGALHRLAEVLAATGEPGAAAAVLRRAAELDPGNLELRFNLGTVLLAAGRFAEAEAEYRTILAADPGDSATLNNLGNALLLSGRAPEAETRFRAAIDADPRNADAWANLALVQERTGRREEARASYREALAVRPDHAVANQGLGCLLLAGKEAGQAIPLFEAALAVRPAWAECRNSYGVALQAVGRAREAADCFRQALAAQPGYAAAWLNLGAGLTVTGEHEEAVAAFGRCLDLDPGNALALRNLATALRRAGRIGEAILHCRRAIAAQPGYAEAHDTLGVLLQASGRVKEAVCSFRRSLELDPHQPGVRSNLLFALHADPSVEPARLFEEHRRYEVAHASGFEPLAGRPPDFDPGRTLRIGYVSPDFRNHPVGGFVLPVIEAHDRKDFEVFCYHTSASSDDMTERFARAAGDWRAAAGSSDASLAEMIVSDRIDILVDLSGHTSGNRLPVFARKPAPLAVTWLGYFDTTGLSAMDYLVGDDRVCPAGCESFYMERILRLPGCYLCYRGPDGCPAPGGVRGDGPAVFGSFNNAAKVNEAVCSAWAQVLAAVPGSRLLLRAPALADREVCERIRSMFRAAGVNPGRLDLEGPLPQRELLREYARIDVALDPFPYNGGTTTCEALWMGVPVVTLRGRTFAGRVGAAILEPAGLGWCVAGSEAEYIEIAARLAGDRALLRQLRPGLRDQVRNSPLGDIPGFTRNLESAFRNIWRERCAAAV